MTCAMSIRATVQDGAVRLPESVHLADGTEVTVIVPESRRQTLAQRYGKFIGAGVSGLSDLAAEHDHYLHGTPKTGA